MRMKIKSSPQHSVSRDYAAASILFVPFFELNLHYPLKFATKFVDITINNSHLII